LVIEGTIMAVSREAWSANEWDVGCFGTLGTDRIRVSLEDADAKRWELSLTPEQIADDRFSVGDELSLDYRHTRLNLVSSNQRLIVRTAGKMDLFFLKGSSFPHAVIDDFSATNGVSAADDSGVSFELGDMSCPRSVPSDDGCSSAKFATIVSAGATSVVDPCAEDVGDFKVTTDFTSAGQAPASCGGVQGFCDATSRFFAAGVRRR
jgi:hypothetical protein